MRKYLILIQVCCVLACLLGVACGDIQSEVTNQARLSVTSQQLGESDSEQTLPLTEDSIASRIDEFIESIRDSMVDDSNPNINVRLNESGYASRLGGEGFAISLSDFGCEQTSREESIRCFLSTLSTHFGIENSALVDLNLIKISQLSSGHEVYRFRQEVSGYPVYGANILVIINHEGYLTGLISKYVPNLEISLGTFVDVVDVFNSVSLNDVYDSIDEQLNTTGSSYSYVDSLIVVEEGGDSNIGIPCIVINSRKLQKRIYYDAATGIIIRTENTIHESTGDLILDTQIRYLGSQDGTCTLWCGTGYPVNYSCSSDFNPKHCTQFCTANWHCSSFIGTYWKCGEGGSVDGYCFDGAATYSDYATPYEIYNDGWNYIPYGDHKRFVELRDVMDALIAHHYNDYGRESGPLTGGEYKVRVRSNHCEEDVDHELTSCGIPLGTYSEITRLVSIFYCIYNFLSNPSYYQWVTYLIGHEFGHWLVHDEVGVSYPGGAESCLGENLADMYGPIFSHDEGNAWFRDERTGLNPGENDPLIPYAHRSYFDKLLCVPSEEYYFDCPNGQSDCPSYYRCQGDCSTSGTPCNDNDDCSGEQTCVFTDAICYDHANHQGNQLIWFRFLRVLDEGPSVLGDDGHNEDVGVDFTGIDLSPIKDLIYDATLLLGTNDDIEDWIEDLIQVADGYTASVRYKIKKALGVIGIISETATATSSHTDKAPYRYYFSAWNQSTKYFYVWKEYGSYDVKVYYYGSSGWTTDTISANTYDAPAVVEYNSRLYIFWRDRSTSAIKSVYYTYNGYQYGIFNLKTNCDVTTDGSFDAVVFNDYLYLVYSKSNSVYLSKCNDSICRDESGDWYQWGSSHKKFVWYGRPGVAADAGTGVNGADGSEYLYYATAYPYTGSLYKAIYIAQINTSDNKVVHRFIPTHYPSYRTEWTLGMKIVDSAFIDDDPSGGKYIYLAWRGYSDYRIYKSIVQKWGSSSYWITKSHKTRIGTYRGVRLQKGDGTSVDNTVFCHGATDWDTEFSILHGRY